MGKHYKVTRWLLEHGANVNANDFERIGETPLCIACRGNYPEIAELLLQCGADPDINGGMGLTARTRAHERNDEDGNRYAALIEQYRPVKDKPGKWRDA